MNTTLKVGLAFLLVFLLGGLSGYMLTNLINAEPEVREETSDRAYFQKKMEEYLDLTEDQQEEFWEKMSDYRSSVRNEMREQRRQQQRRIRDQYSSFLDEVREVLDEEQLERLEARIHPDSVRHYRQRAQQDRPRQRGARN